MASPFVGKYLVEGNPMMAAETLMLLSIVILLFLAQRHFVRDIMMAGTDG